MTLSLLNLPPEVLDLIIDQLDTVEEDEARAAFQLCNMVCKALRDRARHHLFKTILLLSENGKDFSRRMEDLLDILKPMGGELEGIAKYVVALEITIDLEPDSGSGVDLATLLQDQRGMLSDILNALRGENHGIRKFSLIICSRPPNASCACGWDYVSPTLKASLLSTFSSPRLKYLQIESISDLPLDWIQESQLNHLHIIDIKFDSTTSKALSHPKCLPALECLQMTTPDSIKGIPIAALASLSILTSIVLNQEHLAMTWEVMTAADASLEDLSIHFFEMPPPAIQEYDYTKLPKLKCINLTYTPSDDGGSSSDIFHPNLNNICGYLDFGAPLPSLDAIQLLINAWIDGLNGNIAVPPVNETSEWHLLDTLLTSDQFPSLRHVDLTYSIAILLADENEFDEDALKDEIDAFFAAVLPLLHASKMISFTLVTFIACLKWDEAEAGGEL